jgi:hypothetical protein
LHKRKFNKEQLYLFIFFCLFIFLSYHFLELNTYEKKVELTLQNKNFLIEKITLYKSIYNQYPESLNNLITDTYTNNGIETFFIGDVPAEFLTSKYSNKVQIGGKIQKCGNGWWYDNENGKISINNKKINIDK